MSRWISIIMIGCYLVLSTGLQLHLHYCCGHFSDIHFFEKQDCNHGEDTEHGSCTKGSCCSYIHLDFTIDDSHQPSESSSFHSDVIVGQTIETIVNQTHFLPAFSQLRCEDLSPPIIRRFLLFHAIILYA